MKALMAATALLCVSSTVLAHDIYSGLRDRDGHLCCGGQDCKPVQAIVLPNGTYYLPESDETIPANMATPSPDNRFHRCSYREPRTILAFSDFCLGAGGCSARAEVSPRSGTVLTPGRRRSFARCHTDSARERTQAGAAAIRSS